MTKLPIPGRKVHHAFSFEHVRWTVTSVTPSGQRYPTVTVVNDSNGTTRVLDNTSPRSFWRNWRPA